MFVGKKSKSESPLESIILKAQEKEKEKEKKEKEKKEKEKEKKEKENKDLKKDKKDLVFYRHLNTEDKNDLIYRHLNTKDKNDLKNDPLGVYNHGMTQKSGNSGSSLGYSAFKKDKCWWDYGYFRRLRPLNWRNTKELYNDGMTQKSGNSGSSLGYSAFKKDKNYSWFSATWK
jgi:hypothetical protein